MPRTDLVVAAAASFVLLAFVGFTGLIASGIVEGAPTPDGIASPIVTSSNEGMPGY